LANRYQPVPNGHRPIDENGTFSTPWRLWHDFLIRPNSRTPEVQTVGASPAEFIADSDGFYAVSGGTVTAIGITRNGVGYIDLGVIAGPIYVQRGDYIQIVHAGAPDVTWFGELVG
jgi:hypothetical protein